MFAVGTIFDAPDEENVAEGLQEVVETLMVNEELVVDRGEVGGMGEE